MQPISASGQKQTYALQQAMSALPPIATENAEMVMSALPPKDGVIDPALLWIAEIFGCCASG
jgi:hypothetical protein